MPKALSPLQSDQRSFTSELPVVSPVAAEFVVVGIQAVVGEEMLVSTEGNLEFAGYQGCNGYDGCGIVVIYSVMSCKED
jgi:hypothetical protein